MIIETDVLADSARQFALRNYAFEVRQASIAGQGAALADLWEQFADLGWLGVALPEEAGGLGGGIGEMAVILEELGRVLIAEPLLGCAVLAPQVLLKADLGAKHRQLLSDVSEGSLLIALAHEEEGARSSADHVSLKATKAEGGLVLDGRKLDVLGAPDADTFLVSARLGQDQALVLVEKGGVGITLEPYTGYDGLRAANVTFNRVRVPESGLVAKGNAVRSALDWGIDQFLMASAAVEVGVMQAAFEHTRDYLRTREQFGTALAEFQALQHRLADIYIGIEEARALLRACVGTVLATGSSDPAMMAAMTYRQRIVGRFVAMQTVQLHGGIGLTDEYFVGHCCRYLMAASLRSGEARRELDIIAKDMAA